MEGEKEPFPTMLFVNEAFLQANALESFERETEIKQENDPSNDFTLPISTLGVKSEESQFDENLSNLTYGAVEIKIERNEGECSSLDDLSLLKSESKLQVDTDGLISSDYYYPKRDYSESKVIYPIKSEEDQRQETSSECYEIKRERDEEYKDIPFSTTGHTTNDGSSLTLINPQELYSSYTKQENSKEMIETAIKVRLNHSENRMMSSLTVPGKEMNMSKVNGDLDEGLGIQPGDKTEKRPECMNVSIGNNNLKTIHRYSVCKEAATSYSRVVTRTGEKLFKCIVCNELFNRNLDLARHMRTHTGEKAYTCTVCNTIFVGNPQLRKHMKTHTGEKTLRCTKCDKSFSFNSRLRNHMRTHTGEKPFKCTVCDKAYITYTFLTRHMKTHTETLFRCSNCDETFTSSYQRTIHMRTHTGENLFKCTICDRTFDFHSQLFIHMRQHSEEKPFKCTVCDKTYVHNSNLTIHMRSHTGEKPYKCAVCDEAFVQKSLLKLHTRLHTQDEPYKCTVCDKAFIYNCRFVTHMRYHTGEKQYTCTVCHKAFVQNTDLLRHIRTHTGKKLV